MELYRFLQQQGLGSRKECRQLVEFGYITVNGELIEDPKYHIDPTSIEELCIDGEVWDVVDGHLYFLLNKPSQYETSHKPALYPSVYSLFPEAYSRLGLSAVGRLDVDTTGFLVLTTDGQCIHALSSPKKQVPKCYQVGLKHPADQQLVDKLLAGVLLTDENEVITAEKVELQDPKTLLLTITQGKYHQVKRMVAACSNRVETLHRLTIGQLGLGDLEEGEWRKLTPKELEELGYSK